MLLLVFTSLITSLRAQTIKEFQLDTATYLSELRSFTGTSLQSDELDDFESFIHLFDSLSYDHQMDIIEASNLMLKKRCRPRPHFISYQRAMMEFFYGDKTSHGYEEWFEGCILLLGDEKISQQIFLQWLKLSLSLLKENIFYASNTITWKVSSPSFSFHCEKTPSVCFEDVTVACYAGMDFIQIMNASGYIDPLNLQWVGKKGLVTWERVGMPESEINAQLGNYRINLKTSAYKADSVILNYPALIDSPLVGSLNDKVAVIKNMQRAKYPQFLSYKNSYEIHDIVPEIDYLGGLSIEGASFVGKGGQGKPAEMKIYSNDTLRISAKSDRFSMDGRAIRSPNTEILIYFGQDSIFHPDLVMDYEIARERLRLSKSEDFTSMGPYSNSYHNIDMNFEELLWVKGESLMQFQAMLGSSIGSYF